MKKTSLPKLGIIAGGGEIPALLIEACQEQKREFFVLALENQATRKSIPRHVPQSWINLGKAGTGLALLKKENVKEVILIGRVRRPSLSELKPDWLTTKVLLKVGKTLFGDDSLLSAIIKEIEKSGIKVIGIHEVLKNLLAKKGVYGKYTPDPSALADIQKGKEVAKTLGQLDIGQAVVVQQGIVLGVEAIEGTNMLLERCEKVKRAGLGGVLVKKKKLQQNWRVDLPTIGPDTIQKAAKAGLRGIAIEAGGTLVVHEKKTIEMANKQGLFLVGI